MRNGQEDDENIRVITREWEFIWIKMMKMTYSLDTWPKRVTGSGHWLRLT